MNTKITYPIPVRQSQFYRIIRKIAFYTFIVAALVCLIVNFFVKGKPWSIIVVWSLFACWRIFFSLQLSEFSIYNHATRISLYIVVMMILIDYFLAPGWAATVIPIFLFAYLLVMFILYYAMYSRKNRHLISVVMLGLFNMMMIPYSLHSWPIRNWLAFAFLIASAVLFIVILISNFKDIIFEIKARFMVRTK